jgi:hypothetical protein
MGISLAGKKRYILFVVLVIQLIGLVGLAAKYEILWTDLKVAQQNIEANARLSAGMLDNAFSLQKVVVEPKEPAVYLPEFRIKLPYDEVTSSLAYGIREPLDPSDPLEADVRSTLYQEEFELTRVDCSILVRLKLESKPNPYSPHEKASTVNLKDGRTLQVYKSFNEPECQKFWESSIHPETVASVFQKAQSY